MRCNSPYSGACSSKGAFLLNMGGLSGETVSGVTEQCRFCCCPVALWTNDACPSTL